MTIPVAWQMEATLCTCPFRELCHPYMSTGTGRGVSDGIHHLQRAFHFLSVVRHNAVVFVGSATPRRRRVACVYLWHSWLMLREVKHTNATRCGLRHQQQRRPNFERHACR
jgi:hypothetical protein